MIIPLDEKPAGDLNWYIPFETCGPCARAQPYSAALVVVDNGSVDLVTRLRARSGRVPVHVIGCAQHGKGAAVRRGILTSRARFIGYMDADLATPIESLDRTIPLLEAAARR